MDRRRAAGALLALAACIASSAAAPTATNHTALDLYDEPTEGCYYNFQHYGEGDRIMTNEPCLNCTCHNRMLMCYLRVCPFTKAIGQDCTVEKRADQCCPIVTCPDVPVDLLTSTSTTSPAEYGGTGVGKVDKYGCSINGKYFSEGAKVPPTPGKPCEHCYCIRNMTTCVMQECTLHVDGCTPIYHKDVCCPVRYFCDHPEDEMPLLDDMTTTVRPTPGFLLTTIPPTEEPTTTTQPARRDCIEDDQLYPDGALIKTEKPCEHCYCMKGDIVCVVQECGTPMENEGKNCSSLPPREGQCCPDTYICEGDDLSTEPSATEIPFEQMTTTIEPPRRFSVEGSGYRNEPDEIPYTEAPTMPTEFEGSGEDQLSEKPETGTTDKLLDRYGPTEEAEFIPLTTQVPAQIEKATTEPDKIINTVPSGGMEEEPTDRPLYEKTSTSDEITGTEYTRRDGDGQTTLPSVVPKEDHTSAPSLVEETTPTFEIKVTEPLTIEGPSTASDGSEKETSEQLDKEEGVDKVTEASIVSEPETNIPLKPEQEVTTESSLVEESLPSKPFKQTDLPSVIEHETVPKDEVQEPSETTMPPVTLSEAKTTVSPLAAEEDEISADVDSRRTSPKIEITTSPRPIDDEKIVTGAEYTTLSDRLDVTEPSMSEQNTVPVSAEEEQGSVTSLPIETTMHDKSKATEAPSIAEEITTPSKSFVDDKSEPSTFEKTTTKSDIEGLRVPIQQATAVTPKAEEQITTEPTFRKEDETTGSVESNTQKEFESSTVSAEAEFSDKATSTEISSTDQPELPELDVTTKKLPKQEEETTQVNETTTEALMELSTFAHESENEATTKTPESEASSTAAVTEKIDLSETTTINLADNEIAEAPSPGRIPGEGDCLLEGTTYKNESIVPSSNKCHSGCRCVSSIIKCDPIICSPPPEDMDNCQPRYDTPESCCPTYVCDHGMETIPPQPQSHITGTESPTPSTIECHGDECETVDEKQQPATSTQIPDKIAPSDCGSSDCDQPAESAAEACIGDKCEMPTKLEYPEEIPTKESQPHCIDEEHCKETKLPTPALPCDGESCTAAQDDTKYATIPAQGTPQVCNNEEECKNIKIPQTETTLCQDESCKKAQDDCSVGECKTPSSPSQPSPEEEICSKDGGCRKTGDGSGCENGICDHKQLDDKTGDKCKGNDCMQQQPIAPTQEIPYTESLSTEPSVIDKTTSSQPTDEDKIQSVSSKLPTTLFEEVTAEPPKPSEPENAIKEQETPVSDEQEKVTDIPSEYDTAETTTLKSTVTEHKKPEISPEESATERVPITDTPLSSTTLADKESDTIAPEPLSTEALPEIKEEVKPTERPGQVTDMPKPEEAINETDKSPQMPVTEGTKAPERIEDDLDLTSVGTESSAITSENETEKPTTESQSIQSTTAKQVEESSEPGISVTESQEIETVKPGVSTISDEAETKTETPTKGPSLTQEILTETIEKVQTETPIADIAAMTESIKPVTEVPIDATEGLTTIIPVRVGVDEQVFTTTRPTESQTETQVKEITSEIPATTAEYDINKHDEGLEPHVTEPQATYSPEQSEITTQPLQLGTEKPLMEVGTGDIEKATTMPEITKIEDEKQTETPLSLVTKQAEANIITTSITESDEIGAMPTEASSVQPQDFTQGNEIKTEAPETSVPEKNALPLPGSTEVNTTESETFTKAESSSKPNEELPVTESQEVPKIAVTTEAIEPSVTEKQELPEAQVTTESNESFVTEKEDLPEAPGITGSSESTETEKPQPSTKIPGTYETESLDEGTKTTFEKEPPEVSDVTITTPSLPSVSEEEIEKVTESLEPSITEEQEINTETPEKIETEPQQAILPEIAPTDAQDMLTQEPELIIPQKPHTDKPIQRVGEPEDENMTEIPVSDVKQPETIEQVPISQEPMTEGPELIPEEKGTTAIPQEIVTVPEKSKTEIITESPESHQTSLEPEIIEQLTTVSPQFYGTELPKLSTEISQEEAQTEVPIAQEEATSPQSDLSGPEISKTTTISSFVHETEDEDKVTDQPAPVSTVSQEKATISPVSDTTEESDFDKEEQKPHEQLPESTESAMKASTITPEEDEQKLPEEPLQASGPEHEHLETTPYLVELEEHTHKQDEVEPTFVSTEEPSSAMSEEPTVVPSEEPSITSSEGPVVTSTEEPSVTPTQEPTVATSDEHTVAASEEPTIVSSEGPVVTATEEPTVTSTQERTVPPREESTLTSTQEPILASSKEPSAISSEAPIVTSTDGPILTSTLETTNAPSEEPTTARRTDLQGIETQPIITSTESLPSEEKRTELPEIQTERPSDQKEESPLPTEGPYTTMTLEEIPEKSTEATVKPANVPSAEDEEKETPTPTQIVETEKPTSFEQPHDVPVETTAPEEEFIPVTVKATTSQAEREGPTQQPETKPDDKPSEIPLSTAAPEVLKPDELQPTDEIPSPEDDTQFPPSGGYNQEPDYVEEDQAFGPGTCRYGGKVYVSAQQIPRDDPCDFCFCFRSDIICLQQSCPPPIHGCHEEPIQGFCCPRYECPVSMATTLNVTTTTTTTTTTLPPHFLPHAYKGAAQRKGCQIKGHTYQVGEVVRASSGPCLHCTCGGDGQMKCDPKQCTPEPMLRQMIAAAVSAKRRR